MRSSIGVFAFFAFIADVSCRIPRPDYRWHAEMARWLVHMNDWGTLSTVSRDLSTAERHVAFGSTVSYSDGPMSRSTGRLLFYLTPLDASAHDLQGNNMATLSVAEAQMHGYCLGVDPEDPTCAKVALTGPVVVVPAAGQYEAADLLFERHPSMKLWPPGHHFQIYEMIVEFVRLLDFYGGAINIDSKAYYDVDFSNATEITQTMRSNLSIFHKAGKLLSGFTSWQ